MKNREKAKRILDRLTTLDDGVQSTFESLDEQVMALSLKLKETINAKTLDQVNTEFRRLRSGFKTILTSIEDLKGSLNDREEVLLISLQGKLNELVRLIGQSKADNSVKISNLSGEIESIKVELNKPKPDLTKELREEIQSIGIDFENIVISIQESIESSGNEYDKDHKLIKDDIKDLQDKIEELRIEFISRIGSQGGGSMNRQIKVGGVDVLARYTDFNLVAGNNVTISSANNDALKRVDITVNSTGGGTLTEIPSGTIDGVNRVFTVNNLPRIVVSDEQSRLSERKDGYVNYVVTGTGPYTVTMSTDLPPRNDIYSIY